MTLIENSAAQSSRFSSVVLPALFRLGLLVAPLTLAIIAFHNFPVFCILSCIGILTLWLTVDAGPFRVEQQTRPAPKPTPAPVRNIATVQKLNELVCRIAMLLLVFHSKLNL